MLAICLGRLLKYEEYRVYGKNSYFLTPYDMEILLIMVGLFHVILYGFSLWMINSYIMYIFLISVSYTDIFYQSMISRVLYGFMIMIIVFHMIFLPSMSNHFIAGIILFLFLKFYNFIYKHFTTNDAFGNGDADILLIIGFNLGMNKGLCCLWISCILAIIHSFFIHQKKVAFVPYLSLAYLIVNVI